MIVAPFISVIVPNYNHAPYLKERIDSILNQTFQDFEIIILDDCSTDNSKEVIKEFRNNPKIAQIIYNHKNSGNTFKQWRKGIENARGKYIWLAESDDYCEISLLAELVTNAKNCEGCVVSFCQTIMFKDNQIVWRTDTKFVNECVSGTVFVRNRMLLGNEICNASMAIFKRDAFNKVDSEMFNYKLSGDWVFWMQICLQGNVSISGKYLNYFRKHPKDISSKAFSDGLMYIEYLNLLKYFTALKLIENNKREFLIFKYKQFLNDNRLTSENKMTVRNLYKKELGINFYSAHYSYGLKKELKKYFSVIFR